MRFLGVLILSALLAGCGIAEIYTDIGKAIFTSRSQQLDEMTGALNGWLGKSKADYIRAKGQFASCTTISPIEEVCKREVWWHGSVTHTAIFSYNEQGIATGWRYFGNYGKRSSTDPEAQTIKSN